MITPILNAVWFISTYKILQYKHIKPGSAVGPASEAGLRAPRIVLPPVTAGRCSCWRDGSSRTLRLSRWLLAGNLCCWPVAVNAALRHLGRHAAARMAISNPYLYTKQPWSRCERQANIYVLARWNATVSLSMAREQLQQARHQRSHKLDSASKLTGNFGTWSTGQMA